MGSDLERQITGLKLGHHLCLIYEDVAQQMAAMVPFVKEGLKRGERCAYIVDDTSTAEVTAALAAAGVDVQRERERGALVLLTSQATYLRDGWFDPEAMIDFLRRATEEALAAGFAGVRVTGEMTWALGPDVGCDRLIEYEARLNAFFPGTRALAICQYDRRRFPAAIIRDVLRTHPVAILGGQVCPNLYYESPDLVLGQLSEADRVDGMIANLQRVQIAEEALRESEGRFRNLVQELDAIVWEADAATWKFTFVSRRAEAMLGYPIEQWLTEPDFWVNHIHPDDREQASAYCRDSTLASRDHEFEYRSVAADGRVVWLRDIVRVIRDAEGRARQLRGLMVDITAQKQAEEAVRDSERRSARHQMALVKLAQRKVLQDGDIKAACRHITAVATDALDVERTSVWLYNEDRSKIHCVDLYERSLDLHSIKQEIAVTTYPAYFKALEEERVIAAHDCRTDPRTRELTDSYLLPLGITSMLDAPIRWRAKISGIICVEHVGNSRTWSSEEQNFVGSLADFVSLALEAEARQRAEEALAHALKERESIMDTIPDILYLLDLGGNLVGWNRRVEIITGFSPSELRGRPALEFFPEEDRAIIAEAIRTAFEQGYADAEGRLLTKDGTPLPYHWTGVPLADGHGNVIGMTGVGRDITERKRVEETRHGLYRASLEIQAPLELQERLDRLLKTARDVLHLDRLNIFLADPEERWLQAVASLGVDDPLEALQVPIGPQGGGLAQAYLTLKAIIWEGKRPVPEDLRLKPPYDSIAAFRSRAFAIVPLVVQGRAIGVLGADRKHGRRPLEPHTLELLQLFAAQVAVAIQNARLFEQVQAGRERLQALSRKLVAVQEAERHHLARELHDEIGQMLTGVKLTLEMSMRSSPDAMRTTLSEAQGQLNDLMARVRMLSLDLRPAMLDDLGLVPALLWHFERYTAQTSVRVDFRQAGLEGRFRPELETAVYRIVQEALTNVARHAGVNETTVILRGGQDIIGVQVQDQGRGFNPATALGANTSSGLAGMSERAELLGGHLTIESAPGAGTSVTAKFPVIGRIDRRKKPR